MTNPFNDLDFRRNKQNDKTSVISTVPSFDVKKAKSSPLINSDDKDDHEKKVDEKPVTMVGLDSKGILPQRDFQAYFYDILMSALLLLSAGAFFYFFEQVVNNDKSYGIWSLLLPIINISFFVIILLIYSVTVHVKKILVAIIFVSFAFSLAFALQIWHGLVIILSFLITYWTVHQMRKALLDSVKVNIGNLARLGISGITFSVIFIMCSQYYWMVYDKGISDLIPRFDRVNVSGKILSKFIKVKEGEEIDSSRVTVDEFLLMIMKKEENVEEFEENNNLVYENNSQEEEGVFNSILGNLGIDQDKIKEGVEGKVESVKDASNEKVDEIVVETMRKNLSKQIGRELNGGEYITDVFDDMMYEKVAGWFSRDENGEEKEEKKVSYLALFLTVLLFISALTLKSILRPILILLSIGLFWILRKINFIKVKKVKRETEMIISQSSV